MDLTDTIVTLYHRLHVYVVGGYTVNRLETCTLTSVVVHIRLCCVYTKQIEDVHDIKLLYIHNASLDLE